MKYIVYLVGQITANPETYAWRERVSLYFNTNRNKVDSDIEVINPCNSLFNKNLIDNCRNNSVEYSKWVLKRDPSLLVPKDRRFVKRANVLFVNMNMYSPEKPMLGSFFELAWAYDS